MDTGDIFIITDKTVKIGTYTAVSATSSSTSLTFGSTTITKTSENILSIGTANALLFRNGGNNRSFTAKLSGFSNGALSNIRSRSVGIGTQPIGGRPGTRTNTNNESDTQTVISTADGTLSYTDAVANSPQTINIDTTGTNAQPISVTVDPKFDGEFVGTIPVVESGYSFKVTCNTNDDTNGYLYGNGFDVYALRLKINNIGNSNCPTSVYTITTTDQKFHFVSGTVSVPSISGYGSTTKATDLTTGNFSTILPGQSKNLYFLMEYGQLDSEYVDVTLNISITDSGSQSRTWEDSTVVRFYKRPVFLNVSSSNFDQNSSATLKGFIIHPNGKSDRFTVANNGTAKVLVPWSSQKYGLVFSGAGANTEMKYSFAIGNQPVFVTDSYTITEINSFEPNDSETNAAAINNPEITTKSYLKTGDIDFYSIDLNSTPSSLNPIVFNAYAISDSGTGNNNGDNLPNPGETFSMDMRIQNISGSTKNITATLSSASSYITFTKASYTYGDISAGNYRNCHSYSERSTADYTLSPFSSYYAFSLAANTPIGTVIPVSIAFSDTQGYTWTDSFNITVVKTGANIKYNTHALSDSATGNNGDYLPNPGESMTMDMRIHNSGTSDVIGLTATLSSSSSYITFTKASYTYGDISAGNYRNCQSYSERSTADYTLSPSTIYFAISFVNSPPSGTVIPVSIHFADTQGNTWTDSFSITVN